ncbi:hypothetical protein [Undibacterium sp. TS12]|uniref:hypothetical protein n=1 Tax=Undibacterium sp. TS12 TaxID=2908202 RepID=UPI001F4C981E|nr:hypothetical protein [Undibacterium sp. TS12]MCH8619606.1 hypothetical protein [Undibacterium sp. TS12]
MHKLLLTSLGLLLCSNLYSGAAMAATSKLCTGDAALKKLEGYWADTRFLALLDQHRTWADAMQAVDSQQNGLSIKNGKIKRNLAWHEGDESRHCLRQDGDKIWLQAEEGKQPEAGPYLRLGSLQKNEADLYLAHIIEGCFASAENEQWCFHHGKISINGKAVNARLELDLSELDLYGTPLRVQGRKLPFWYLVRQQDKWAVFEDDYASNEQRKPVDPRTSKPWRLLKLLIIH